MENEKLKLFFNNESELDSNLGDIENIFQQLAQAALKDERLQRMLNPEDD